MYRVMLLGVAMGIAASAQAQIASIPPAKNWTQTELDRLFDGKAFKPSLDAEPAQGTPEKKRILYSEADPPPAAPRYALDLDAVPKEFRHTIRGFEKLYHKNQEETREQVDRINERIREHNRDRAFGRIPEWTYDDRPNEPVWNCLAHGAGTSNDWWSLELGKPIPKHESITHGGVEEGIDPYMLELEYNRRTGSEDPDFVAPPKFIQEDPVRHTGFPYEPRGYAKLLIEDEPYDVTDPITGKVYHYDPSMSAMEGERLIRCSANKTAEDWGRTAYFISHDSFGDFPAAQPRTAHSAAAYRAVRITSIDQAIVFPHGLRVVLAPRPGSPGAWEIRVTNNGGKPVDVLSLKALGESVIETPVLREMDGAYYVEGAPGDELRLYVEALHYFGKDGRGRGYAVRLAEQPRTAVSLED